MVKEFAIDKNYIHFSMSIYKNKNKYNNSNKIWLKLFSKSEGNTCIAKPIKSGGIALDTD